MNEIIDQFDPNMDGKVDYISWSMMLSPKDLPKIISSCRDVGPLALATPTEEEIELIDAMFERGRTLAKEAAESGTRLLIDAEQVRFQPAIDNLVLELQRKFNSTDKSDFPVIYNTYQCYLKDAPDRLRTDVERSERYNYHFGMYSIVPFLSLNMYHKLIHVCTNSCLKIAIGKKVPSLSEVPTWNPNASLRKPWD